MFLLINIYVMFHGSTNYECMCVGKCNVACLILNCSGTADNICCFLINPYWGGWVGDVFIS